jgi:hypothetical protein
MARIFRMSIEVHPPNQVRPGYCIETFEQVRQAQPNRILHFGIDAPVTTDDVAFVVETIGTQLETLINRTLGQQEPLRF